MDKNDEDQKDDDSIVGKVKRLTKVNNITTIDSISEKNEESSNSNIKNSNLQSQNILFRNTNTPEMTQIVNNLNVRLKKPKRQTIDSHYNNKKLKSMRRKDSKKKTELNILKRISFQQNNSFNFYTNMKTSNILSKRESIHKKDEISTNQRSIDYSSKNNVNLSRTESFVGNK